MTTLTRALNSIGKKCFVDYFYDFKDCDDKIVLANKLLSENLKVTSLLAQMTRINYARWIFENGAEEEALSYIIASDRIDDVTRKKAKVLLEKTSACIS